MKYFKNKLVIFGGGLLGLIAIAFLVLNAGYFSQQLKYIFTGNNPNAGVITPHNNGDGQEYFINPEEFGPNMFAVPSLGIIAPIVESTANNENAFQEALKNGVVHYPGTAKVGEVGNTYIFGHSSDYIFKGGDYKTIFALLPKIQNDAEIIVSNNEGKQFKYIVKEQFVAESNDLHLLEQNTNGKGVLTLQTSYPLGTALRRYIVKAELLDSR